ncbi:hypothetical protein ACHQM5_000241 [Ranunculus cassubicifolius]
MPRSSRHKSHKQHKHSSKEAREYSDSEEVGNLKDRKDREEVVTRVSASSEKRKLSASQGLDGKDVFNPGNSEEYTVSKRRKEKGDGSGGARWSTGEGRGIGGKESKGESSRIESEKGLKSKVSVDSKSSKSSRRHDSSSEKKEMNAGLVADNEEVKRSSSSKAESRSKSERDSSRKEYKESKDKDSKDKDRVAERSSKSQDIRQERSVDKGTGKGPVDSEGSRKQSSHFEERAKPEVGNTEWPLQEDLRNPESEKEVEKRMRRKRDGSVDKDKHSDDIRDSNGRKQSTKDERHKEEKHKDEKYKDEKHKDDRYRDKYRDDLDRDRVRDHRNRDDRVKDDRSSKDHTERSDSRHSRDEIKGSGEYRHKKSKTQNSDHDGSSSHLVDDRATRYKDYRGKKRSPGGDDDRGDIKPRNTKEHRYEVEKKVNSSGKVVETLPDRGRSQSRLADGDSTISGSRRKASHSPGAHYPKDNFRHSSKQSDVKYKESVSEERTRANVNSPRELLSVSAVVERASESQSMEKSKPTESPLKKERSPMPEAQVSPMQLKEKSHSSTSMDRRPPSNRTPVRRSSDANDDREWPLEKQVSVADEFPQADADSASISSSLNRTNSSSLLPPPPPTRTSHENSPSVFYEEDTRGKPVNRYRRSVEPNRRSSVEPSRRSVEPWKGMQSWPSPVTNGFLPFQQGLQPGGFHPMMQPFHGHGPPIFRPPHGGYHIADTDTYSGHGRQFGWRNRPDDSHMHGWDGGSNNGPFGDEGHHMYGKQDSWDPNRHMISDRNWEGQNNNALISREDNQFRAPVDEGWVGKQPGQRVPARNERSRSVTRAESIEVKRSDDVSVEQILPTELSSPKPSVGGVVEKNMESSKVLNSGFCSFYLSKLHISVDLTHPDLYNQCVSLMDMKGKSVVADVTNELSAEENGKAGLMMVSNDFLSAPIFPKLKDSLFKKAMSLYKKQGEETRAKFPVSKNVPTNDEDDVMIDAATQEPVLHLEEEGKDEATHTTMEASMEVAEVVLTIDNEKAADLVPDSAQEIADDSVLDSAQDILPEPFSLVEETVDEIDLVSFVAGPVSDPVEQLVPPAIIPEVKMEEPDADVENHAADVAAAVAEAVAAATETIKVENVDLAANENDDNNSLALIGGSPEEVISDETTTTTTIITGNTSRCGELVDGSSEAIDECKSVNLSRIHSPESTH